MRLAALLALIAAPAAAWEASQIGPVCLLTEDTRAGSVRVSHDPRNALPYAIQLRRESDAWKDAPVFSIRFDGPGQLTISTDRHRMSDDNTKIIAADTGFGNVLKGLESNHTATALLGDQSLAFSLAGAAPEVAKFRSCVARPSV